jgi:phage antirepressor YoqD-like protein
MKNLSFKEASMGLGIGRNSLLEFLREEKILYISNRRNVPYSKYLKNNWFECKAVEVKLDGSRRMPVVLVRITSKGYKRIEKLLLEKQEQQKEISFQNRVLKYLDEMIVFLGLKDYSRISRKYKWEGNKIIESTFIIDKGLSTEQFLLTYNLKEFTWLKNKSLQASIF